MTPISWSASDALDLAEWAEHGRRLGLMGRGTGWWIGDWLRYGNERYGEKYTRAARLTGYDVQTLMNMVYVASRFEISRRRENLSWSHHAELAALPAGEQDAWLERSERDRLSIRSLREELSLARYREARGDRERRRPSAAADVVCPRCGFAFGHDEDGVHGDAPAGDDGAAGARTLTA